MSKYIHLIYCLVYDLLPFENIKMFLKWLQGWKTNPKMRPNAGYEWDYIVL